MGDVVQVSVLPLQIHLDIAEVEHLVTLDLLTPGQEVRGRASRQDAAAVDGQRVLVFSGDVLHDSFLGAPPQQDVTDIFRGTV